MDEHLEVGLRVVERMAVYEPSVADVVDALEVVLEDESQIAPVMKHAEAAGLIDREADQITVGKTASVPKTNRGLIVTKSGEFACLRCGRALSTGYFIRADPEDIGPYGSTCIRKVTGRE